MVSQKSHQDLLDVSAIQLDSSLSQLGTLQKAKKDNFNQEAKLSQLLAVSQNISGLMTVSQKELIQLVEQGWEQHQQAKIEKRKVLEWSGNGLPESLQSLSDAKSILEPNQISESFVNESSQFYDDIESLTPSQIQAQQME